METTLRVFEDKIMDRLYVPCYDSGLAIYDYKSKEIWTRKYNPKNIPLLNNEKLLEGIITFYIDRDRRNWLFQWPTWNGSNQKLRCFDSTGKELNITSSLGKEDLGYAEFHEIVETGKNNLWVIGLNVLYSWDQADQKFYYHRSETEHNYFIQYDIVHQVMEDKGGSLWFATDKGLFFTNAGTNRYVTSVMFDESKGSNSITDILQLKNGDYWFGNWGNGVIVMDKNFNKKQHNIYTTPVPASWGFDRKGAIKLVWSLHQHSITGKVWIGTNGGVLNVHDPVTSKSTWLAPPEFNASTIRSITEDEDGTIWFGTQGGRLIKYEDGKFQVVYDVKTIVNKVFIDRAGWIWIACFEKGLYAVNRKTGEVIQHYQKNNTFNSLYSNTGNDIEQINDSTIVFGAGALNFINKNSGKVTIYDFHDGLPSNTVERLRVDKQGNLWIMTTSGLCRYTPSSHAITPFGRKDGIIFSDLAKDCDYVSEDGNVIFGGENALMFFDPQHMEQTRKPLPAVITDIKLFNDYIPLDSISQQKEINFKYFQNSFGFYFSSVSYLMNDKMKFFYKLTGAEEEWISTERNNFVNYSHLPPGKYVFNVYSVNSEGLRSEKVTQFAFQIQPPFWKTNIFIALMIASIAALIYLIHKLRINRILAVQQLRNRVARDLHDDMGSTLSTINILSSMAKSKINTDTPKATEFITKISDNSQRMMEAMDDIVWSIKPSNDSMEKITARMREFATNVPGSKEYRP
jgi:streptogramin lyase